MSIVDYDFIDGLKMQLFVEKMVLLMDVLQQLIGSEQSANVNQRLL